MAETRDIRSEVKALYLRIQLRMQNPQLTSEERENVLRQLEEILKSLPEV